MPSKREHAWWSALAFISVLIAAGPASAVSTYEIQNCTKWEVDVRAGLTEFDFSNARTLTTDGATESGTFVCDGSPCTVVYGRTGSACSWSAMQAPGSYVLRHVHSRMTNQCSYATENFGDTTASQFYYLTLEPGSTC